MRRWRLNSGYCGNTDQRRTAAGTIPILKHYMERDLGVFSSSVLWTPAQITTALWLDADDASTITLNVSTVSQWNDKSGNGRNATQATAANQPARTLNSINGKTALTFDGSNDNMAVNYSYHGNSATLFAVVARLNGGSNEQWVFSSYSGTNGTPLVAPMWAKGSNTTEWSTYGGGSLSFTAAGAVLTTDGTANILSLDSSITDSVLDCYTNGTRTAQHPGNIRFTGGGARNYIGAETNGTSRFLSGRVAEIIQIESRIDTNTRQRIEGYLAWKWGLQASLPVDHPYKNAAPAT
jgi:hypothetical protein